MFFIYVDCSLTKKAYPGGFQGDFAIKGCSYFN